MGLHAYQMTSQSTEACFRTRDKIRNFELNDKTKNHLENEQWNEQRPMKGD